MSPLLWALVLVLGQWAQLPPAVAAPQGPQLTPTAGWQVDAVSVVGAPIAIRVEAVPASKASAPSLVPSLQPCSAPTFVVARLVSKDDSAARSSCGKGFDARGPPVAGS
ncbi:MAG: hypothetical protein GX542_12775 [Rhodococcus sp.]|nr:hypothetical protein [Rhodococcus sp. (in: high G+C Gram-positive bacteria)]